MPEDRQWYCENEDCGAVLGELVEEGGRLLRDLRRLRMVAVNSHGTVQVQCRCGHWTNWQPRRVKEAIGRMLHG